MASKSSQASTIAGFSVICAFVVGIAAAFFALLAVVNDTDYVGAGLCLLAAAVVFGYIMNAVYRA